MSLREMKAPVGAHVYLEPVRGFRVRCRVTDVKKTFGRPRVQIEPLSGEGQMWVSVRRVLPCYPALAHCPDIASREKCYLCGQRIGDAEYLANEDNTVRHFACPVSFPDWEGC